MVAEATASSMFEGFATVAELWASLPGWPTPRHIFGDRTRCLTLEGVSVPQDQRPLFQRVAAPTHATLQFTRADPNELPELYPTIGRVVQDGARPSVFGGDDLVYAFPREDGTLRPLHEVGSRPFYAEGPGGYFVVRPRVGTANIGPPSEFLTLWALLFCLSELARYYPETWVNALDPDQSRAAVTLEHGLDLALERAPSLINGALSGPIDQLLGEELERMRVAAEEAAEAAGEAPEAAGEAPDEPR
jgi:hypothetical protein